MPSKKQAELGEALKEQSIQIAKAVRNQENLANKYRSQEKVPVQVSPLYRPYFGNVMKVCINGISIYMPIDNTVHYVPKTFADENSSKVR